MPKPILVIHGGAGSKPRTGDKKLALEASLEQILVQVYPLLLRGKSAVHAVTEAVCALENDPLYNAGKGSKIQSDGHIRMSAALMDGHRQRFSGCINVESVKNPIKIAAALLPRSDRVLSGEGAKKFARELGLEFASPFTRAQLIHHKANQRGKTGTVGALALDAQGRLAAATSTGGKGGEYPFRVSDSATCAGNFANAVCAVSATGVGEEIVEAGAATAICSLVEAGFDFKKALLLIMKQARRRKHQFGLIALNPRGNFRAVTTTRFITWAAASENGFETYA